MNIDEAIAQLTELRQEYGNLELFDSDHFQVDNFIIVNSEDNDFPNDWNMPEQFVSFPYNR